MKPELIETDPDVMMSKPVVSGTRITVELVLEKLAAGETIEQLLGHTLALLGKGSTRLWRSATRFS